MKCVPCLTQLPHAGTVMGARSLAEEGNEDSPEEEVRAFYPDVPRPVPLMPMQRCHKESLTALSPSKCKSLMCLHLSTSAVSMLQEQIGTNRHKVMPENERCFSYADRRRLR